MANGNFAGGDGSANNPYLIEDVFDLDAIRNGLDKCYKLIDDIDLDIKPFNEGEGWNPIGGYENPFNGNINGNNKIIKNLYINRPPNTFQGLFGRTSNSTILNLNIVNVDICASNLSGTIVGESTCYTNILNCSVSKINARFSKLSAGGICGGVGYSCNIKNCYLKKGTIQFSQEKQVSTLIGSIGFDCNIINCFAICDLITSKPIGGLIGLADGRGGVIKNCFCNGTNTVGILTSNINGNKSIVNCFWNKDLSNQNSDKGKGITEKELKIKQTFIDADWDKEKLEDGTSVWKLQDGEYPRLWFEKIEKYLIQDKTNILYTLNENNLLQSPSQILDENNFINNGFTDIDLVTRDLLLSKFQSLEGIKLLVYTDNLEKKECEMIYNCERFRPIDKLKKNSATCNILFKKV
ncbi:hypothetical protein [Clostridium rectalis]|uniref:hypothetical protein n=1 Tax=Clostridium rectalis TaxID=2040295 RepID=UPI001FAA7FDB|nr:hypothetical protein [Clostridium rectalis]